MKDYTKKRRYILVTCCLANLCLGSVYAWSVFASPMAEYLSQINGINITTGDLAIVYTIANSVGPITTGSVLRLFFWSEALCLV